ncbi:MAG: 4Fe-4S binding protein [Oscillospiraceae bacterium]|jgi:2-oxoacid:acceptor oxidoreductase delta subunit (pyruvate/2-ketoisovalerate family)|nr:4Fe-4S binding protein [Oscillospiraceae bacterium]
MQLKKLPDRAPEITAFEAGYLVSKNGGWRSVRPVIDKERCVRCGQCYLYCPDGTISPEFEVDYDFCKGCGICAKICKRGAIMLEKEADHA